MVLELHKKISIVQICILGESVTFALGFEGLVSKKNITPLVQISSNWETITNNVRFERLVSKKIYFFRPMLTCWLRAYLVLAGVVDGDHFGFDVGFETYFVVLPDYVDFLTFGGAVEVDCVVLIAKGQGNKVRAAGFGI